MKRTGWILGGAVALIVALGAYAIYTGFDFIVPVVAMGVNYVRYMHAPKGTIEVVTAPNAGDQTATI